MLEASSTLKGEMLAKAQFGSSYKIKDLGDAKLILGMQIDRKANGDITLSQHAYYEWLLERFNMSGCAPLTTPLLLGLSLTIEDGPSSEKEKEEMMKIPYHKALGSLMWLQVATRPDLAFAVGLLARFAHNPGKEHWRALKHVMGYVKGTISYGIMYQAGEGLKPIGYVDSDFAGCQSTRRSTDGNIFLVAGGPVSWESK